MIVPAPWMVAVVPSPVDPQESERPSGLIVQHASHDYDCARHVKAGVVSAVGSRVEDTGIEIKPGDRLYYHEAALIGDTAFVAASHPDNILGWERH